MSLVEVAGVTRIRAHRIKNRIHFQGNSAARAMFAERLLEQGEGIVFIVQTDGHQ